MEAIKEANIEEVTTETVEETVESAVEEVIERPYTLRKLKDGDLMPLLSLFRRCGLKEFKETIQAMANGANAEEVGITAILSMGDVLIAHLEGGVGNDIYEFYSGMSGIPVDEMKEMEFGTLPLMIYDSFSEVKNTAFFKVLSKLL